ncbi:hypothetical protein ZIOFF_052232 [Zingiber officinale]|uniref:SP-RING-type domain-containing protein n=1 Tax=Zingiber officinale TaxID=94328 RepID=A0A8J5FLQ8_ZINOF|nr:hypothetical protein ZIOFF_052232 [Zingiber officinale]
MASASSCQLAKPPPPQGDVTVTPSQRIPRATYLESDDISKPGLSTCYPPLPHSDDVTVTRSVVPSGSHAQTYLESDDISKPAGGSALFRSATHISRRISLPIDFCALALKELRRAAEEASMATTSTSRSHNSTAPRIRNAASTLFSDNQSLISDIRKAITMMKNVAVDLEKEQQSEKVKELENSILELLETYDDCARFSEVIQTIGSNYIPSEQPTDFKRLLEDEVAKSKESSPSMPQNNPLYRQFKEAIWVHLSHKKNDTKKNAAKICLLPSFVLGISALLLYASLKDLCSFPHVLVSSPSQCQLNVHHAGQPMSGEEQEDIVMTSTQNNLLNTKCPLTGKPVIELQNPVRCMDCKHIYEKEPVIHYISTKKPHPRCPVAGCPKILQVGRVVCDALLTIEIDEMRLASATNINSTVVEDFTEVD